MKEDESRQKLGIFGWSFVVGFESEMVDGQACMELVGLEPCLRYLENRLRPNYGLF